MDAIDIVEIGCEQIDTFQRQGQDNFYYLANKVYYANLTDDADTIRILLRDYPDTLSDALKDMIILGAAKNGSTKIFREILEHVPHRQHHIKISALKFAYAANDNNIIKILIDHDNFFGQILSVLETLDPKKQDCV